jgi:hypothetical protein
VLAIPLIVSARSWSIVTLISCTRSHAFSYSREAPTKSPLAWSACALARAFRRSIFRAVRRTASSLAARCAAAVASCCA